MNLALVEMFRYNKWANLTLLQACRVLTDQQLDASAPGASGAVRELLVHIVGGQQTFILRTKGRQHEGELNRSSAWPGLDRLVDLAASTSDELIEIARRINGESEADLKYRGKRYRYPARLFLAHALEHGVEHRTEAKLILAQHGIDTPSLDGWDYSAAAGYDQEVEDPA
jgi:uncharacterized damage-inducible protein DinB